MWLTRVSQSRLVLLVLYYYCSASLVVVVYWLVDTIKIVE